MKSKMGLGQWCLAFPAVLVAGITFAHHSVAMWDNARTLAFVGTVKSFQWTNPHCVVRLLVPQMAGANGEAQEWRIEMASPNRIHKFGWRSDTFKPGDSIKVTVHPARDGSLTGSLIMAFTMGGQPFVPQVQRP